MPLRKNLCSSCQTLSPTIAWFQKENKFVKNAEQIKTILDESIRMTNDDRHFHCKGGFGYSAYSALLVEQIIECLQRKFSTDNF